MKIKLYAKSQPTELQQHFTKMIVGKSYTLENGQEQNTFWFSEIEVEDYQKTKSILEKFGYTAHPASSNEIETNELSIFQNI